MCSHISTPLLGKRLSGKVSKRNEVVGRGDGGKGGVRGVRWWEGEDGGKGE